MDRVKRLIYMDHAATTPVAPGVVEAMTPYWSGEFGNPASSHAWGQVAATALERARQAISDILGCRPVEIVFTGSGTEADNLALRGVALAARQTGRGNHLITTPVEHHAVGTTVEQLRGLFGFEVTLVSVDSHGHVDLDDLQRAIRPDTVLVSIMMANNEVGTVERVARIGRICREHGVLFHTDAVQAAGRLPLEPEDVGVDLLSISAHKIYGPKGIGALYVRRGVDLVPPITGGEQERGRRPGTVDVAQAVGLGAAFRLAEDRRVDECARLRRIRDSLIDGVLASVPDCRLTGHPRLRLCNHASFAFREVEGESVVVALDLEGIAVSSGAACAGGESVSSFVLEAMGFSPSWGIGAVRFSLGRDNTEADVDEVLKVLPPIIARLRSEVR
ncbi:MAG: cysteine desulfurase family protein [Anaerolineae bacterium]|jgi:cysteine desulfurase